MSRSRLFDFLKSSFLLAQFAEFAHQQGVMIVGALLFFFLRPQGKSAFR